MLSKSGASSNSLASSLLTIAIVCVPISMPILPSLRWCLTSPVSLSNLIGGTPSMTN